MKGRRKGTTGPLSIAVGAIMIGAAGCFLCSTEVVQRVPSPTGDHTAVVSLVNCGATTSYVTQVTIDSGVDRKAQRALAIESIEGARPTDLTLAWSDAQTLDVTFDMRMSIGYMKTQIGAVSIRYAQELFESPRCPPGSTLIARSLDGGSEESCHDSDDKKQGFAVSWFESSAKRSCGRFEDDVRTGYWVYWDASGRRNREGSFEHGEKHGTWLETDSAGKECAGEYARGRKVEAWVCVGDQVGQDGALNWASETERRKRR